MAPGPNSRSSTATAGTTVTLTTILVTDSDGEPETATQSSVSTRTLSTEAMVIPNDGTSFDTYISRVWVVAQHDAVQLSWKRPTDDVGYRFWRAPAGDSAYTELVEFEDSTLIRQPKNGLSSRFYYSDTTVTAATEYKYAVQVLDRTKTTARRTRPSPARRNGCRRRRELRGLCSPYQRTKRATSCWRWVRR